MKKKLYFKDDAENCYTIEDHIDQMKFDGETEREVFVAKVERGTGYFYCCEFSEIGEVKESCGKQCDKYKPRNGRGGICKRYGFLYEQTDKSKVIKL